MLPGDFAVVATPGLMGRLIRLVTRAKVNHAVISVGDGKIMEAAPAGARLAALTEYDGLTLTWSHLPLTQTTRDRIVDAAYAPAGAPYSWVDAACIGLAALLAVHVPGWVRRRMAGTDHLQCSQLVDVCYADAGVPLFDDGRLPGDVSPGDLAQLIASEPS